MEPGYFAQQNHRPCVLILSSMCCQSQFTINSYQLTASLMRLIKFKIKIFAVNSQCSLTFILLLLQLLFQLKQLALSLLGLNFQRMFQQEFGEFINIKSKCIRLLSINIRSLPELSLSFESPFFVIIMLETSLLLWCQSQPVKRQVLTCNIKGLSSVLSPDQCYELCMVL